MRGRDEDRSNSVRKIEKPKLNIHIAKYSNKGGMSKIIKK